MQNIEEGLRALRAIQRFIPGAILAGGYLRDAHFGRAQKDIDIFVPHSPEGIGAIEASALAAVPLSGPCEYMERGEVDNIWNVGGFELPVQIIMLSPGMDPVTRAKHHDFGVCQIWHDGERLHTTGYFVVDVCDETFTLVFCEDQQEFDRSMRRWERLKAKYPEFALVYGEEAQPFVVSGGA